MKRVYQGICVVFLLGVAHYSAAQDLLVHNDVTDLDISTDFGERILEFDFDGMEVGIAEYPDGPTGVTVLNFPQGASVAVDIRGGSPGFLGDYSYAHAISLAGGSLYGLEAASGVRAELLARREYSSNWQDIPLVTAGIVFDFGSRANSIYPDKRLGRAALKAAVPNQFPLGQRGAGSSVTVGKFFDFQFAELAGQGAAFRQIGDLKLFACVVLNAVGAIHDRDGSVVRGQLDPANGKRQSFNEFIEKAITSSSTSTVAPEPGNTTLTVVVTNQTLQNFQLQQLAKLVHSSMSRAIQPFHTDTDGDVLWFASTNQIELASWSPTGLGVVASELVWDAVLVAHP